MPSATRMAATVMILRDSREGIEVFMVQRTGRAGFMPGAWVFPGGRVDPSDGLWPEGLRHGGHGAISQMGIDAGMATAFLVAAVRETWEESGIFLGEGHLPDQQRDAVAHGSRSFARLVSEHGARLSLDAVTPWSWWVTPEQEPRRYDTRFFVARGDGLQGRHDDSETVNSRWIRPEQALATTRDGSFPLAPPTWWTLTELSAFATVANVLEAARDRSLLRIQPVLRSGDEGLELILPGHDEHPEPEGPEVPRRIRFAAGKWWAS